MMWDLVAEKNKIIEKLEKEKEEMKTLIEIQYQENQMLGNNNTELLDKLNIQNQRLNELKKENEELKAENKKLKSDWKSCFLSCSSPYCARHFPAVKMEGELGNMSKHEGE